MKIGTGEIEEKAKEANERREVKNKRLGRERTGWRREGVRSEHEGTHCQVRTGYMSEVEPRRIEVKDVKQKKRKKQKRVKEGEKETKE